MKVNYIFMMGVVSGMWSSISTPMDSGGDGNQVTQASSQSPRNASRFVQLMRRSSFRSNSGSDLDDQQASNQSIVGSPGSSNSNQVSNVTGNSSPSMMKRLTAKLKSSRRSSRTTRTSLSQDQQLNGQTIVDSNAYAQEVLSNATEALSGILRVAHEIFEDGDYSSSRESTKELSEVDRIIAVLDHVKDMLNLYRMRTDPDFVISYEKSLKANFENVGRFDLRGVYPYLEYVEGDYEKSSERFQSLLAKRLSDVSDDLDMDKGSKKSSEFFKDVIAKCLSNASDDKEKALLRQIEYPFRNSGSKKLFDEYNKGGIAAMRQLQVNSKESVSENELIDAYSEGGKQGVAALRIDSEEDGKRYAYLTTLTIELKEELRDTFKKNNHQGSASHHADTHNELAKN